MALVAANAIEQLKKEDSKCIALGLSLIEATEISKNDLNFFINKLISQPIMKPEMVKMRNQKLCLFSPR